MSASTGEVSVIDLAKCPTPQALADAIRLPLSSLGFLYVLNHGMEEDVARMFRISETFFKEETEAEKERCGYDNNKGYTRVRQEVLDPTLHPEGDLKEVMQYWLRYVLAELKRLCQGFNTGIIVRGSPPTPTQPLPSLLAKQVEQLAEFQHSCFLFCQRLLEAFAIALGIEPTFFTSQHFDEPDSVSILRFLHYPAVPPNSTVSPNRAGAHSDYGSLTLLFQRSDGGEGLQVLPPSESLDGTWKEAGVIEGALLVNIGDAMEFWSGCAFKSTLHRVRLPTPIPAEGIPERFSIAYFNQPAPSAMLASVLPRSEISALDLERMERKGVKVGETVSSGAHLAARLNATYQMTA